MDINVALNSTQNTWFRYFLFGYDVQSYWGLRTALGASRKGCRPIGRMGLKSRT